MSGENSQCSLYCCVGLCPGINWLKKQYSRSSTTEPEPEPEEANKEWDSPGTAPLHQFITWNQFVPVHNKAATDITQPLNTQRPLAAELTWPHQSGQVSSVYNQHVRSVDTGQLSILVTQYFLPVSAAKRSVSARRAACYGELPAFSSLLLENVSVPSEYGGQRDGQTAVYAGTLTNTR